MDKLNKIEKLLSDIDNLVLFSKHSHMYTPDDVNLILDEGYNYKLDLDEKLYEIYKVVEEMKEDV